jgi:hypothetical protein
MAVLGLSGLLDLFVRRTVGGARERPIVPERRRPLWGSGTKAGGSGRSSMTSIRSRVGLRRSWGEIFPLGLGLSISEARTRGRKARFVWEALGFMSGGADD